MKYDLPKLPICAVLTQLQKALATNPAVVLSAEPGSGKTTIAPLSLMDAAWLAGRKIIMLEPRRLAVRMAAKRLSELVGDRVGGLVGYRIRFDTKVSPATRMEVVTEGVFTRMIQNDPELTNVGLVIFDEFHVRSIAADLALAFCLDILELRDNLKIMIMSATMDTARVADIFKHHHGRSTGAAPVITGKGRCFPVTVQYLPTPAASNRGRTADYLVQRTTKAIRHVLDTHDGDVLVFLPGAGEIKAVQRHISRQVQLAKDVLCLPLYGNLPQNKQDLVFAEADKRRLILATPIAETSLTIEGVSVVIDSGLMKTPRFSPTTGLTSLHTVPISRASAEQRAGRAGRLGPGTCYRLWTKSEHHSKADFLPPEIIGADLAPLLLEVLQWGVSDPDQLTWLDPPRSGSVNQARDLLEQLGVMNHKGGLTDIGRKISSLPLHPRLALMLLRGHEWGNGLLACRLAALMQNRDPFCDRNSDRSVDIEDRLDILRLFEQQGPALVQARGADPAACRHILREAGQYQRLLGITSGSKRGTYDYGCAANLLTLAYPDRIAQRKPGSKQHLLSSGRGVLLPAGDHLHKEDYLVAAHVDGGKKCGRIFMAAALSLDEIVTNHSHILSRKESVTWRKSQVEAVSILSLGKLEISRKPLSDVSADRVRGCLIDGIKLAGLACLGWQKKSRELKIRMELAHLWDSGNWLDVSDDKLTRDFHWLEPYLDSISSLKQLKKLDMHAILLSMLSWQDQQKLERLLPTHFQVPSGSKIRLLYQAGEPPILAVRLQEMFGATDSPTVFAGKVPVIVHLLSPAGRIIQITKDLAGFWQRTYTEVKKELQGRYPKHFWPDDPLSAKATNRAKRKNKKTNI